MGRVRTLDDLQVVRNKRALVRVDFNVPIMDGRVTDATRIVHARPTLEELKKRGARVVLLSHLGRPEGKPDPKFSNRHILPAVREHLGPVAFAHNCIGEETAAAVDALREGEILLLENVRFYGGEEANDPNFAEALARSGDFYVNDAFSVSHRAHASTEGVTHFLKAYAGRGMQAEIDALERALESPQRPVTALVGGAKVSTKLGVLDHLTRKVETLVIGGAMANTFLAAQGQPVGASLCERELADTARGILARAEERKCRIVLPVDVVVAETLAPVAASRTVPVTEVAANDKILDIGSRTLALISVSLEASRTVLWNGPLGAFEVVPYDTGTLAVARQVALLTKAGRLVSVAGGGDTVAALNHAGVADDFTYVSTAGGAFLEWLEGKTLPGVKVLA